MTALYLERYLNFGLSREELQSGKPIIGIAQTGSDLSPCNRHHIELAERVRDGIREAGGIAIEFPVHPIQETGKRPTAGARPQPALSRPRRGALRLSARRRRADHRLRQDHAGHADGRGDGQHPGHRAVGRPDAQRLVPRRAHRLGHHRLEGARDDGRRRDRLRAASSKLVASSAPSTGYCNTMGTATTMNSLAEALGMQLPGSAAIPAPYRDRQEMAYRTGKRIVEMVREDLKPSDILTTDAFINAIVVNSAIGGSTNAPDPHQRHRPPYRRRADDRGLADLRPRGAAAGQPAAGRRISRRGLLPCRRRAGGGRPS